MEDLIIEFKDYMERIRMFSSASAILGFDSSTIAPRGSVKSRAKRSGFFAMELHNMATSEKMKGLLEGLGEHVQQLDDVSKGLYRIAHKRYEISTCLPAELVKRSAQLSREAMSVWEDAREKNDFSLFAPYLKELIQLEKEKISYLKTPGQNPYDVLLDDFEEGMNTQIYDDFFDKLKDGIVPLLKKIQNSKKTIRTDFLSWPVPIEDQKQISLWIADKIGYDLNRGHISESVHPFCSSSDKYDARITTRYTENDFQSAFYGILHECGHAIYEQNTHDDYAYLPLGSGASMGMHESQSRFYENMIGRSLPFWEAISDDLKTFLPKIFKDITPLEFFEALNVATPSFIRVEADELTYSLHILIRYEIEKMLFTQDIDVADVPGIWNSKYEEYLGITPPTDTLGVLQDMHWSGGAFGYFPTYALGSAYSAQLYAYMKKELDVDSIIKSGDFSQITDWLARHIHIHGSVYTPTELIKKINGEPLNADYYIDYLVSKFSKIYQL